MSRLMPWGQGLRIHFLLLPCLLGDVIIFQQGFLPVTPPPPPIAQHTHRHTHTRTQPPCHHKRDIRASFTTARKGQKTLRGGERKNCIPSHNWHHITHFTLNTQLLTFKHHRVHTGRNWNETGRLGGKRKRARERERRTEQTENRDEGETSNSIEISTKCFQVQFSSQSAKKKGKKSPSKCVSVWSQQWKWWSKPHKDKLSFWATHTASPSTIIDHLRTISSGVGWTLELLRGKEVMNKRKFVSETVHFHFVLKQRPEPLMCQLLHRYTQASEWDAHSEPPRQQRPDASVREKSRYSEILNTETFSTNKHTEGSKQKRYVCVFDLLLQDFPLLSCHDAVLTCWSGLGTNNT